ncbi:hypothetical protein GCM10027347_44640 [Larkinella harenae]
MLLSGFLFAIAAFLGLMLYLGRKKQVAAYWPAPEKHPQDRYTERIERQQAAKANEFNPLDWLGKTTAGALEQALEPKTEAATPAKPEPAVESHDGLLIRYLPHLKPLLYAGSIALLWFMAAAWYNNLSLYVPEAADAIGDFRILFLKKVVGAVIPCLSAVAASVLMFFMLFPPVYKYLNGWTSKDFDLYTDLKNLDQPGPARRVMFFCFLFTLFFLAFLHFFPLSLQDLTL